MSTAIPLYGFGGGSGGSGGTLTVTAPADVTVTVSKDGKSYTKTADSSGTAVFKGLKTGTWTVTITDGAQSAAQQVTVNADYGAPLLSLRPPSTSPILPGPSVPLRTALPP